jgi:hypothetical protein
MHNGERRSYIVVKEGKTRHKESKNSVTKVAVVKPPNPRPIKQ